MHFMPNNNLEENISHFILIAPTKQKKLPPKIAFQILGTHKLHLGNQVPGSRKFSCPGELVSTAFSELNTKLDRGVDLCAALAETSSGVNSQDM